MKLKTNTLFKVSKLFEFKQWRIEHREDISSLFFRYCERLKLYNEDQQDFIIELTKNYERVELNVYLESFYDSLILLGDNIFHNYDNIYIFPLLKPTINYSKTKSAGFLHYMLDSDDYRWLSDKIIVTHKLSVLKKFDPKKSILILIDDYVGSGDTAIETINEIKSFDEYKEIPNENIKVVAIVSQEQGINNVKNQISVEVIANKILKKGISDFYPDFEDKIIKMREISQRLNVKDELKLGYKDCEGLITMLQKTPNNTFPVYWFESGNRVAPFPRKKYFKNG